MNSDIRECVCMWWTVCAVCIMLWILNFMGNHFHIQNPNNFWSIVEIVRFQNRMPKLRNFIMNMKCDCNSAFCYCFFALNFNWCAFLVKFLNSCLFVILSRLISKGLPKVAMWNEWYKFRSVWMKNIWIDSLLSELRCQSIHRQTIHIWY